MLAILTGGVGNFAGVGRVLHRAVADVAFVVLRSVVFAETLDEGEETRGAREKEILQLGRPSRNSASASLCEMGGAKLLTSRVVPSGNMISMR